MLQLQLLPDEKVLWSGRPKPGLLFHKADILRIPLSLMICGFAFFWEGMVIKFNGPLFFKLWGLPFVLFGLYVLVGRFVYDALLRDSSTYAVTNQGIVIVSDFLGKRSTVLSYVTLTDVTLDEGADGWGTISFGPRPQPSYWGSSWSYWSNNSGNQFDTIANARSVYNIVNQAMRASGQV